MDLTEKQLGNLYRKLNQYPYIEQYDTIKKYLESGKAPNKKFENRYKDFELTNNGERISYIHHKLNLQVIKTEEEKEQLLKRHYHDYSTGLGKGIKTFYKIIASKYLGITRADIKEFLERQVPYQLTKAIIKPKNPTKKYRQPNKVWYLDLIDLQRFSSVNKNFKYIMSVIDASSHICWLRKLKAKTAKEILKQFQTIYSETNPVKMIVSDNGTEFQGELKEFLSEHNIKHETSKTYTPVALIENLNGKIRKLLQDLFARNKGFKWEEHLKKIEDNLNNYQLLPRVKAELDQQNGNAKNNLKPPDPKFKVGDYVRISENAINSFSRKAYKEGNQKSIIIKYSVDVFIVTKILSRAIMGEFHKYTLQTIEKEDVLNSDDTISRFSEKDLMLVPDPDEHSGKEPTEQQKNKLNQYD